ncbi:membrane or secreted protein [gut metagenome]|uniref:Membrane or secreted protein n=1 Tax=gut metagenome TaxID=749906 RepID=J9GCQ5_9ZZZZ
MSLSALMGHKKVNKKLRRQCYIIVLSSCISAVAVVSSWVGVTAM